MRNARHRRRTWAERHEESAILLTVVIIGILMGYAMTGGYNYFL